uniref:Glycoprotein hormone subunit beta 5 n=1 Tax=Astyanax mexicanus TaxID=7994 RepID=A0A8B9GNS1_ASTMX
LLKLRVCVFLCFFCFFFYSFSPLTLGWVVLSVWLCVGGPAGVSGVNLRKFIGCAVREFAFIARKPGCGALPVTTDACWGRCETWEVRHSSFLHNLVLTQMAHRQIMPAVVTNCYFWQCGQCAKSCWKMKSASP